MTRGKTDPDRCRFCGSEELWSNYFDVEGFGSDGKHPGDEWKTLCQGCGEFQ